MFVIEFVQNHPLLTAFVGVVVVSVIVLWDHHVDVRNSRPY